MNNELYKEIKYVTYGVFFWILGGFITLLILVFGYVSARIQTVEAKIDASQAQYTDIRASLAQIQTDILWIRKGLDEHLNASK